jgi:hypothetical protein
MDLCDSFRRRCTQDCEPRPQPQNALRFQTFVGNAKSTRLQFHGTAACTWNPFAEDRKKGLRVSFTSPPQVSSATLAPWSMPSGNSFELECGENQYVFVEFNPTEPGVYTQPLYKWEVRNGSVITEESFTLIGEALPTP